jgi:hypothetical protein
VAAATVLALGTAVMVSGTFAPWLRSGQVTRDSYRTAGLLQRLLDIGGAAGAALDALPLLGLVCAISAVTFAVGWRRTAAGVLSALAVAMGALAVAALSAPSSSQVQVVPSGPLIVLIGAILSILAAVALVFTQGVDKHYRGP